METFKTSEIGFGRGCNLWKWRVNVRKWESKKLYTDLILDPWVHLFFEESKLMRKAPFPFRKSLISLYQPTLLRHQNPLQLINFSQQSPCNKFQSPEESHNVKFDFEHYPSRKYVQRPYQKARNSFYNCKWTTHLDSNWRWSLSGGWCLRSPALLRPETEATRNR